MAKSSVQTIAFRPMLESDLDQVMATERLAYPFPWSEGNMRDCLKSRYCCQVLEVDGQLRGYWVMSLIDAINEAHILNVCVHPGFQGKGFGRLMMDAALREARTKGISVIFLEVRPSNQAAIGLYEAFGFNEIGCRRDYYPLAKGREDALVMACYIGAEFDS